MDCTANPSDPICIEFYGGQSPQNAASSTIAQLWMPGLLPPANTGIPGSTAVTISPEIPWGYPWAYKWGMSPKLWGLAILGALGAGLAYKKFKKP